MSNLKELLKKAKNYSKLSDDEKKEVLQATYHEYEYSGQEIADACGTYRQKIFREMDRLGVERRDKSDSTKVAIRRGRKEHPTKGRKRSDEEKESISESLSENWETMSTPERQRRAKRSKEIWDNKPQHEKDAFIRLGQDKVREAAAIGSKLERYLLEQLYASGYDAEFHKTHFLRNETLHLDIFLGKIGVVIEVDGPSHFDNIWGEKALNRSINSDLAKNGIVLAAGLCFIRIQQRKSLTEKSKRDIWNKLIEALRSIEEKFPSEIKDRLITIGDTDG